MGRGLVSVGRWRAVGVSECGEGVSECGEVESSGGLVSVGRWRAVGVSECGEVESSGG